jgi:hypothetical protein
MKETQDKVISKIMSLNVGENQGSCLAQGHRVNAVMVGCLLFFFSKHTWTTVLACSWRSLNCC